MLGFYYLKRLVDRKVWDEEEVKTDLGARVQQLERVSSQALDSPSRLYNSKDPKQQQHAVLFDIYMELLEEAVTSKIDGIYWRAEVYGDTVTTPKMDPRTSFSATASVERMSSSISNPFWKLNLRFRSNP